MDSLSTQIRSSRTYFCRFLSKFSETSFESGAHCHVCGILSRVIELIGVDAEIIQFAFPILVFYPRVTIDDVSQTEVIGEQIFQLRAKNIGLIDFFDPESGDGKAFITQKRLNTGKIGPDGI